MPNGELVSVRNLVDTDFGTPLRKFYGVLANYMTEPATGYEGTRVNLNFSDVEVLQAIEPYNFPTAIINIGLSNKKKSKWGYFGTSLGKLIPTTEDIKNQMGRRMGLIFCDGQEGRPEPKPIWNRDRGEEVLNPVWEVFEVAGVVAGAGAKSAIEKAKELLDGKTRADFNKAAYADPIIRADDKFQRTITDKSFINSMVQIGEFTEDGEGVFHSTTKAEVAPGEEDVPF